MIWNIGMGGERIAVNLLNEQKGWENSRKVLCGDLYALAGAQQG